MRSAAGGVGRGTVPLHAVATRKFSEKVAMPLPAAAEASRRLAAQRQHTRNLGTRHARLFPSLSFSRPHPVLSSPAAGAFLICGFIGSVFFYCTRAVGQDQITAEEVASFRAKRALEQSVAAPPPSR